jgi:hypothetical protein
MCFTCGAGEFELNERELVGLDYEEALQIAGREFGESHEIHARINTPHYRMSQIVTSNKAMAQLVKDWRGS